MVMMVQIPRVGSSAGKKVTKSWKRRHFKELDDLCNYSSNVGKDKRGSNDHSIEQKTRGTKGQGKRKLVRRKSQHQARRTASRKE